MLADELRAYRARGSWVLVAWLLASFTFELVYQYGNENWSRILASPLAKSRWLLTYSALQVANLGQQAVWNAVMYAIMLMKSPFFDQYRISSKQWAWVSNDNSVRAEAWGLSVSSVWRALVINNILVGMPLIASVRYLLVDVAGFSALRSDMASFPTRSTLLSQLAMGLVLEDAAFYLIHRSMHTFPVLYRNIHKIHHEYRQPAVSASEHAHPLEFILGNLLPVIIPVVALRMHLFAAAVFVGVRIFVSAEEHCGYEFPWSPVRLLPFQACVAGHDFHHSHNVGVYASQFMWWDRLCGTDAAFRAWRKERLDRAEAAHAPGKGASKTA